MGASLTEYRWLWPSALSSDPAGPVPARRSMRDWVVDTLCFVIGFGFTVAATIDLLQHDAALLRQWHQTPDWLVIVDGGLSGIAGIALWWRRRFMIPLGCYLLVLSTFSVAAGPTQLIVMFTIAVHRRFSSA